LGGGGKLKAKNILYEGMKKKDHLYTLFFFGESNPKKKKKNKYITGGILAHRALKQGAFWGGGGNYSANMIYMMACNTMTTFTYFFIIGRVNSEENNRVTVQSESNRRVTIH